MKTLPYLALMGLALSSCSQKVFRTDVVASTKSQAIGSYKALGTVSLRTCNRWIYPGIITFSIYPNIYQNLMDQSKTMGGNAVMDFQVRSDGFVFFYPFYSHQCYLMQGTAVKLLNGEEGSAWDKPQSESKSSWDNPNQTPPTVPSITTPGKTKSAWDKSTK